MRANWLLGIAGVAMTGLLSYWAKDPLRERLLEPTDREVVQQGKESFERHSALLQDNLRGVVRCYKLGMPEGCDGILAASKRLQDTRIDLLRSAEATLELPGVSKVERDNLAAWYKNEDAKNQELQDQAIAARQESQKLKQELDRLTAKQSLHK